MTALALLFVVVSAAALVVLPRRWAPLPLIAGACYIPQAEGIALGPLHFSVVRVLIAIGVLRACLRREAPENCPAGLDLCLLGWAIWACFSSAFHKDPGSALIFRLGLVYDACGLFFLLRIFCRSIDDARRLSLACAILLVPVAAAMCYEKVALFNLFSLFGGISEIPVVREGVIRAGGPFGHPILAGTIGAVSLPLMTLGWQRSRVLAALGVVACGVMIVTSASSGPIMSAAFGIIGLSLWRIRQVVRPLRWAAVAGYIGLDMVMHDPAYYIMARIDIVGGSTGYHRSRLIESSIEHLGEWWFAGTDYTRHWMATGVPWSANHTDITNHYVRMGVVGGLPLMLLFIAGLGLAFSYVGRQVDGKLPARDRFVLWALGSALFCHAITCLSVAYFDQSIIFLFLTQAAIASGSRHIAEGVRQPGRSGRRRSVGRAPHLVPRPRAIPGRLARPGRLAQSPASQLYE